MLKPSDLDGIAAETGSLRARARGSLQRRNIVVPENCGPSASWRLGRWPVWASIKLHLKQEIGLFWNMPVDSYSWKASRR